MPNGLTLSLSQESVQGNAHAPPNISRPIGCSSGSRADGIQAPGKAKRGEDLKGRARAKGQRVCVLPLPIRAFNMPSRDPLLRAAHTSLECQDNGQQARAVTPHFLCTELSNHDRCRQCRCRHYQGPLHFLAVWPSLRHTTREEGAAGAVVYSKEGTVANLRHLWCGRCCLSFSFFSVFVLPDSFQISLLVLIADLLSRALGITTQQRIIMFPFSLLLPLQNPNDVSVDKT